MEENKISTEPIIQQSSFSHEKKPTIFFVIFLVVIALITLTLSFSKNFKQTLSPSTLPVSKTEEKLISLKLQREDIDANVSRFYVVVYPLKENISISAFEVSIFTSSNEPKKIKLVANKDLEKLSWQFPLLKAEATSQGSLVKISGFRMGNSPHLITENTLLAYFDIPSNESATFSEQNIKFYAADAVTLIPYKIESE